ncbi:hypothetical protein [Leifsonia sp. C5G2]|uniref:hypothetical protein n=1 Tax=Leifsonia sp. C5G2 TaxID=2735269 RepID=UPI0015846D23|nr:hypothetical protein [Leifsonia sp. C5G2]NUU06363.1 hypothetical protein [Leifsonia sp. C5G2]
MNNKQIAAELTDALIEPEDLPVPLKALIAATVMSARGAAPTRLGMAKTGSYSYGSSQTHYAGLLDALIERIPAEVAEMAQGEVDPALAVQMRAELQQRDTTIASLRAELAMLASRHEELRKYALALHQRTSELDQQQAAQQGATVRRLRSVD